MPFHAHPSGRSGYPEPASRPELPSPTGVFRLLALVAAIAGSSVALSAGLPSSVTASQLAANPSASVQSAVGTSGKVRAGSGHLTMATGR